MVRNQVLVVSFLSILRAISLQAQEQSYSMSAPQFMPFSSATTYSYDATGLHLYSTVANGVFLAEIHPPNGAILNQVEFDGCNRNSAITQVVEGALWDTDTFGNDQTPIAGPVMISPNPSAPCQAVVATIPGYTVDNTNRHLIVQVTTSAGDDTTSFSGIKVMYNQSLFSFSSLPAFADVPPSSPIFPYVQWMFANGITAGCGGGNYCPNSPVTRGQMSVFFTKQWYDSRQ